MTNAATAILDILKTLLAILPTFLLLLATKKVNLKKEFRDRQFLMPVFAFIFAVVVMIFLGSITNLIFEFLRNIPIWLNNLVNMEWIPENISDFLKQPVNAITDFINGINLKYWVFYVTNTVIMLAYLLYKRICISIMQKVNKKNRDLHNRVALVFYEYFPDKDIWCIKDEYVQARTFAKVTFYVAVGIMTLIMLVSGRMYGAELLADVFYPVFSVILVGEVYFFLDGASRSEYLRNILGEDEDAYKTVNYSLLRKYLRNLFSDKLLSENTNVNNSLSNDITNDEVIDNLLNDPDPKITAFATYYSRLNKAGFELDHNYINSSLDLLNGKSILFNNPFYKDLIPYAFYPMNRALLTHKKVLVVLGRHSIEDEIIEWIHDGIESITNIPFMWKTGILDQTEQDLDIGILTRSDVINIGVQQSNRKFLEQVGFVVILEPSKLITTAQIGLNLLVKKCRKDEDKEIVFCLCDKNCDGLVDAMSHILMTNLTEVSATNKHKGTCSYMCWEADSDYIHHRQLPNISRYLGMGTELSFAALKNQVSSTEWYGGEAFPVTDMSWIARQYYYDLMKYAALPTKQEAMGDYFHTSPGFWSAEVSKNNYFTVEDESYNMYEILRDFSTRSTEQGFVNVISSAYILKDYMSDNNTIFETDAKAIPCLVADFARTNRNVILRLLLLMSEEGVDEETVKKELSLAGLPVLDLKKQLWYETFCSLSSVDATDKFPKDYREAVEEAFKLNISLPDIDEEFNSSVIQAEERYDFEIGKMQIVYYISNRKFIKYFVSNLKSASYVSEDEKGEKYYLGAELRDHIYQKLLPGQFFTYNGKYYEMQYVTHDGQVLVRRASDHIDGRPTYRQLRRYNITSAKTANSIGAVQDIDGIKLSHMFADFSVTTDGYYRMDKYNDFETAKKVYFEGESSRIPDRRYSNKAILKIDLPNTNGAFTTDVRYTITLLMNEVFRSLFAENAHYISALTDDSHIAAESRVKPLTYTLTTEFEGASENSIYIVEDASLDMGLLITVERNLKRIFRIIEDYLLWNKRAIALSLRPPLKEEPLKIDPSQIDFKEGEEKKEGALKRFFKKIGGFFKKIFQKIANFFKKIFGRKRKKDKDLPEGEEQPVATDEQDITEGGDTPKAPEFPEIPEAPEETPENGEDDTPSQDDTPTDGAEGEIPDGEDTPIEKTPSADGDIPVGGEDNNTGIDISDIFKEPGKDSPLQSADMAADDNVVAASKETNSAFDFTRKPYHQRYYLLYGGDGEPDTINSGGALAYLRMLGLGNNPLKEARKGKRISKHVEATFQPNKKNARYCDFCGSEIYGVEFETLADGRDRCVSCGRTAIKTEAEFVKIFEDVKRNLESFFGIKINAGIRVEMVNAAKLNKSLGNSFVPTSDYDGRVLGVAKNSGGSFTLMVENGSPRMMSMLTMAHELTHIWQYINWDAKAILRKYGKALNLQIYEGMAKWVEIQYAYLINEPSTAKREEIITASRDDEYGYGYIRYKANYPITTGTVISRETPFMNIETPLDPMYCGSNVSILMAEDNSGRYDEDLDDDDYDGFFDDEDFDDEVIPISDNGVKERDPSAVKSFAYEQLGEYEKEFYDRVYSAVVTFEEKISDIPAWVNAKSLEKIRDYLLADHPEIFWFSGNYTYYSDKMTGVVTALEFKYCMTKAESESRQAEIDSAITAFEEGITESMSDYDVAKQIYTNIINLVDYDSVTLNATMSNSDGPDDLRSIYGVFVNRKAVCAGYAKATQYLMNKYGIDCTVVTGTTNKDGRHAWNIIRLEGDYYHLDTTWDDHSNTDEEKNVTSEVTYNYFCVTTEEILMDHTPDDTMNLPECTATKCNYYYRSGKVLSAYSFEKIRSIVRGSVLRGEYSISIKLTDASEYRKMISELIDNKKFFEIIQYLNLSSGVRISSTFHHVSYDDKLILRIILTKV